MNRNLQKLEILEIRMMIFNYLLKWYECIMRLGIELQLLRSKGAKRLLLASLKAWTRDKFTVVIFWLQTHNIEMMGSSVSFHAYVG
jgi:hypothetical protein